ncbi:hypothetical protein SK128_024037 [Halocaridina rubra]|uniref:Uncharacterized protein n=1 Tax=Halocaridina rubra TaxID=373956 RepID=A0AAN9AGX6_HALRR
MSTSTPNILVHLLHISFAFFFLIFIIIREGPQLMTPSTRHKEVLRISVDLADSTIGMSTDMLGGNNDSLPG